jgi:hypothetical protein
MAPTTRKPSAAVINHAARPQQFRASALAFSCAAERCRLRQSRCSLRGSLRTHCGAAAVVAGAAPACIRGTRRRTYLLLEKVAQLFDMLHRCRIDNSSALELPDQAQQLPLLVDCDWSIAGSWWHNDFPTPAGMIASVCRPASTASMTACCPGRRPVRPNTRFRTVVTRRRAIGGLMVKETPSRPRSSRRQ